MKRDYRELYKRIAKSEWFRKAYHGKSLGDFIPVDKVEGIEVREGRPEWGAEPGKYYVLHPDVVTELEGLFALEFAEWSCGME